MKLVSQTAQESRRNAENLYELFIAMQETIPITPRPSLPAAFHTLQNG